MNTIVCKNCNKEIERKAPAQKFCPTCSEIKRIEARDRGQREYRKRKGLPVGVGRGGSNKKGADDSQYKSGIGTFQRLRKKMKEEINRCNRCGKDLSTATHYQWACHHIDHDRTNNDPSNFELLCKRCHQLEHDCFSHLNN